MARTSELRARIIDLYVGQVRERWPGKPASAIEKAAVEGPLSLARTGFSADAQADLSVHGGQEKAVHHYPAEHYDAWRAELGEPARHLAPGGFGENIATIGLTEADLCIGDVLSVGSAVVEISQGRQPCWKLGAHTGLVQMPALFQKTARTGWYYRVLEPGLVAAGDEIRRIACPNLDWTVERVTRARLDPRLDSETAAILADLPSLNDGWRKAFQQKAQPGFVENTAARLKAPSTD
jgi:MOSC domain-containing protein YiiM